MELVGDVLTNQFISKIKEMAESRYNESVSIIQGEYSIKIADIRTDLLLCVEEALNRYRTMREHSETGPLASVYISFLRTSILYDIKHYRIDLYDERGRSSLTECAVGWDFSFVFRHFEQIKNELTEHFGRQTKAKEYDLDAILYELGLRFQHLAENLILDLIKGILPKLQENTEFSDRVSIFLGEFLDKSKLISECEPSTTDCHIGSGKEHTESEELR